ncbi:MAG: HAMP domain-containing histidine kinase [Deltaproteobacteria bacterium]|nr:HAMP domain-containing histidine kinase [Deltaproteobacteria bacterium]
MKPTSSLFAKILSWLFLNLMLVTTVLAVFFAFQPYVNLHAIFGQPGAHRLRTAGMLISHDLNLTARENWTDVLARHAKIHGLDFVMVLRDGSLFSSTEEALPERVMAWARGALRRRPPGPPEAPPIDDTGELLKKRTVRSKAPGRPGTPGIKPPMTMSTRNPTRYWSGIRIPLFSGPLPPPSSGLLLAVSNSVTGNGFFFDPLPWIFVAAAVVLISVLFWIPMIRNITRPLARMTLATEEIAEGRFDVTLHEPRADEIGRLARAVNHMTARLSAFVKGQKRFFGDVAHELGSPIARIQFGLGALEQRVAEKNRKRVMEVMEDVDQLSKLVSELLAFSRADMQSKTVELESIDLLPVVETAVKREVTPTAKIITQIDSEIRVVASSELLTRALANLVRNAVKYAGPTGPIVVSAEKRKDVVKIEVRDNGAGVSEDLLDQLFEPFFRPEPSRDRDSGGVGLGLAIVKTCVEACNGTVSAANRQPNGFTVAITLKA